MIYFNINIRNPWWLDRFENIKNWFGPTPLEHKFWEVQVTKCAELFRIEFDWTIRQDHAGLGLELALLGYTLTLGVHDARHWDYDKGSWKTAIEDSGW